MSYSARLRPPALHLPLAFFLHLRLRSISAAIAALSSPYADHGSHAQTRNTVVRTFRSMPSSHHSLIPVSHLICNILCSCSLQAVSARFEACTTAKADLVPLPNLSALAPPRMLYDILSNSTDALLRSNISSYSPYQHAGESVNMRSWRASENYRVPPISSRVSSLSSLFPSFNRSVVPHSIFASFGTSIRARMVESGTPR
jgi:hypothetical protein